MVYHYTKRVMLARLLANKGPAIYVVYLNRYFVIPPWYYLVVTFCDIDEELAVSANFLATMHVTCQDKPWIPFYQCSKMHSEYSIPECILLYCQNDNQIQSVKGKKSRINSKHWKKIRNYTDWWQSVTRDLEVNQNKIKNNIFTTVTKKWLLNSIMEV